MEPSHCKPLTASTFNCANTVVCITFYFDRIWIVHQPKCNAIDERVFLKVNLNSLDKNSLFTAIDELYSLFCMFVLCVWLLIFFLFCSVLFFFFFDWSHLARQECLSAILNDSSCDIIG